MPNSNHLLTHLALALAAATAQAQTANYCDGRVVPSSTYSTLNEMGYGAGSRVSYHMELQNQSTDSVRYTVQFTAPNILDAQNGSVAANLASKRSQHVNLGRQIFPRDPTARGKLSLADVIRYTRVTCSN